MWSFIKKYLGWRGWAALYYNSIFENIFIIFYITLRLPDFSNAFLVDILIFILFSMFSTTYGYLINDLADKELDRKHGKENTFADDSKSKAAVIVVSAFLISVLLGLRFCDNYYFIGVWIVWLAISTFYSLPPLRLKERGKTGLIFVILAQRVFPILLVFAAFEFAFIWEIVLISMYILLRGASSDINHQLEDYENDLKTGTKTSAVELGKERLERILRIVLEGEKIFLLLVLILTVVRLNKIEILTIPVFLIPLIVFAIIYGISWIRLSHIANASIETINPYYKKEKTIFQFIHLVFPNVFLPLYFIFVLIYYNYFYSLFILVYIIIFRLYDITTIKHSYLGRLLFKRT